MDLYIFCLCCVVQPIFHYYSVYGKRESLQRFVVEEGAKPELRGEEAIIIGLGIFTTVVSHFHYYSAPALPVKISRHRAIFGSYSYDPVKQVFVPPPADNNTVNDIPDQIVNGSFVYSTAVGDPSTEPHSAQTTVNHTDPVFRKHVTPVTRKNTAWWIRPKLPFSNITSGIHKLNKIPY